VNLYLDTEYNGFGGALISMALVTEDEREWYEVLPCAQPTQWVAENVMPVLLQAPVPNRAALTVSLYRFLTAFDRVHVIADWPEDIRHFCDVLIAYDGRCIPTPPLTMEIRPRLPESTLNSVIPHNALADARALRDMLHLAPEHH
jgi:hypothetical protein